MIYSRPASIDTSELDYLSQWTSVEAARKQLFNIGAGAWIHNCWTNLDLPPQSEAFAAIQAPCIYHDLVANEKLPIESGTAAAFYCSHVVEHLPDTIVSQLFSECYRCLEPGGTLRLVTGPCADLDWSAMMRRDSRWWFWHDETVSESVGSQGKPQSIYDRWLHHVATPRSPWSSTYCDRKYTSSDIEVLVMNNKESPETLLEMLTTGLAYDYEAPGNHISWWNARKLKEYMEKAGFSSIKRSAYGQSDVWYMRDLKYFDQTYPQISVYVEARK